MKPRSWLACLAAAGVAGVLACALKKPPIQNFGNGYSYAGETFLHHRLVGAPMALPLLDVSAALMRTHIPGVDEPLIVLILIEGIGLVLAATAFSASPLVFLALLYRRIGVFSYVQVAYSFLILLAAAVLAWRARKPTWKRSLALGLALGASLLFRSPLAFFPPLLALFDWRFSPRRPLGPAWRTALLAYVLPYLFLVPWMKANWSLHHRLVPFENGEANCNVVTGALGLVQTIEGPWPVLVPDGAIGYASTPGQVLAWAAGEVVRHPGRYAAAYGRRLLLVAGWAGPLLCLAALGGVWLGRRRPEIQALALLLVYFVAIHCFMSIERTYAMPVWPLAALLMGALADRFAPVLKLPAGRFAYGLSRGAVGFCLAAVLGLCLYVELLVAAPIDPAALDRAALEAQLARHPREAWLLFERGRRRFHAGDPDGAAADMERSLSLQPDLDISVTFSQASPLLGRGHRMFQRGPLRFYENLRRACDRSLAGRSEEARRELSAAVREYKAGNVLARGDTARELDALERLRGEEAAQRRIAWELSGALARLPPRKALRLIREMAQALPDCPELWPAGLAARVGDLASALRVLARAESRDADLRALLPELSVLAARTPLAQAQQLVRRIAPALSGFPEFRLMSAELEARAGRRGRAVELLEGLAAEGIADLQAKRRLASLYRESGRYGQAKKVLADLAAENPDELEIKREQASVAAATGDRKAELLFEAELERSNPAKDAQTWLKRALLAGQAGQPKAAAGFLAEAARRRPGFDERRQMASLYRDLGLFARARELLDGLGRERPADVGVKRERAALAEQIGDRATARALDAQLRGLDRSGDPHDLLQGAAAAAGGGERERALALLARAKKLGAPAADRRLMASLYRGLGRLDEAEGLLASEIKRLPRDPGVRIEAAAAAAQAGKNSAALVLLSSASALSPDYHDRLRMASLYRGLGRRSEAAALLAELAGLEPEDPSVKLEQARSAAEAGDAPAALGLLRAASRLDADFATRHRMALQFQELKSYAEAVEQLEKLARRDPENAEVRADMGTCRYLSGDVPAAISDLKEAIKLDPRFMASYLTLGAIYAGRKDYDSALSLFDSALAVEAPKDSSLRDRLLEGRRQAQALARGGR